MKTIRRTRGRRRGGITSGGLGWAALVWSACQIAAPAVAQWTQWGGPHRDFTCDSTGLANAWPDEGPRKIWSREIGAGHSSILVDGDTLYTMCRRGDQDAVLAARADDGATVWETAYDAPVRPNMALEFGPGPHSTPLVVGDRIFTVGAMTHFHCLDKRTGKILWSHDLGEELGTSYLLRGYGASPIAYRDTVIIPVGPRSGVEDAGGIAAFKQDTGEIVWKSEVFSGGYPSPIIVNFSESDLLIDALGTARFGLDPATGETRFRVDVDRQSASIMSSPLWIAPDRVFFTAAYGSGSRLFKLSVDEQGRCAAEELWHNRFLRVQHGDAIRIGDTIYGSSGDFGPAFLMAVDLETGKTRWRKRGFGKATLLPADGKVIILDERGILALATATPEGLEIHAQAQVLEEKSWTIPTLVGTRLYLRDNRTIMCLDLGAAANS